MNETPVPPRVKTPGVDTPNVDTPRDDTHRVKTPSGSPPDFDDAFQGKLLDLFAWRRDVRRFRTDPLPEGAVRGLIDIAGLAPSVGNSQPWRFVTVRDAERRAEIVRIFEDCNHEALNDYHGDKAKLYASLKLSGLVKAPEHVAVYADVDTNLGSGLGQRTMPETLAYSVVGAVNYLWLAARAQGIGVGWVSILEPKDVSRVLDMPDAWKLIAYLCIGYPDEEHIDPELHRHGWQERLDVSGFIIER